MKNKYYLKLSACKCKSNVLDSPFFSFRKATKLFPSSPQRRSEGYQGIKRKQLSFMRLLSYYMTKRFRFQFLLGSSETKRKAPLNK